MKGSPREKTSVRMERAWVSRKLPTPILEIATGSIAGLHQTPEPVLYKELFINPQSLSNPTLGSKEVVACPE